MASIKGIELRNLHLISTGFMANVIYEGGVTPRLNADGSLYITEK